MIWMLKRNLSARFFNEQNKNFMLTALKNKRYSLIFLNRWDYYGITVSVVTKTYTEENESDTNSIADFKGGIKMTNMIKLMKKKVGDRSVILSSFILLEDVAFIKSLTIHPINFIS